MDFLGDTFPYFRPNYTNMEALRAEFGADSVVGIVPTGWMYQMKKTTYAQQSKEACTIHLVPYSEHSRYKPPTALRSDSIDAVRRSCH